MGEAKRKKAHIEQVNAKAEDVSFARIAQAINKLSVAASDRTGADCIILAGLAQAILNRLGVPSEIRVGYAAWRVGEGDGDVISHIPQKGVVHSDPRMVPFHAWLQVGDQIFDLTTGQLRMKARQLDAQDGGHTTVDWAPDFLLTPYGEVSSYRDVAQGSAGLFFYQQDLTLTNLIMAQYKGLDQEDVEHAWILYQNPDLHVIGPNDIRR